MQFIIMPIFKSLALLLAVLPWALTLTVADFKPALFHSSRPSGFYSVTTGAEDTGLILGFADLNGDKYTDYLATDDPTQPALIMFLWVDSLSLFKAMPVTLNNTGFKEVSEAMICDVDSDGLPEIVVTFLQTSGLYSSQIYDMGCSTTCWISLQALDYTLLTNMTAHPFLVDIDGSGKITFFVFNSNNQRIIVKYNLTSSSLSLQSATFSSVLLNPPSSYNPISLHFASMVDINGDCSSDLVILSNSGSTNSVLEFYLKANNNFYQQLTQLSLGKNITWLTFADLNSNGASDIFLVALEGSTYTPYAILNPNSPQDICAASSSFPFSSKLIPVTLPTGYSLVPNSNLKFADINFDGLPDLLGLFSVGKFKRATVLLNRGGLSFGVVEGLNIEEVSGVDNPVQICPFDFGENGKMDVMVISQATTEQGETVYVRTSVVNNIIDDSLFITILPLLATSPDFDSGSINAAIGVTVQWRITNIDGDKTIAILNQKSQWNHGSLQLPFVTDGLGRTNNYIEDLAVGYPGRGQVQTWTPIIPNSQLMVRRQVEEGAEWDLETLLKDNERVYDVIYISIVCLLLLGVVVAYLNWRETQEDKRDHYNFIQMIR